MEGKRMNLNELAGELDALFELHQWETDPIGRWVSRVYRELGYDHTQILEPDFCRRHNGLMLRTAERVTEVYTAAFPTPGILETLLGTTRGQALLALHHPVDMEVSGAGFLPIPPEMLERLRAAGVSIYACHGPMDCHDRIGTNASIVAALGVEVERPFAPYGPGFAGRIGTIPPAPLPELIRRGQEIFGVERVEIGGARPDLIDKVAIVAGGGDEVELMEDAEGYGAQAYVSGEWYTRTLPQDEGEQSWVAENRAACEAYAERSSMALLAFSHAATEFLVMRRELAEFFRERGLRVHPLEQADWWR
jgi:putative NIF3 family GTP cyclohydrolase 1 type 2